MKRWAVGAFERRARFHQHLFARHVYGDKFAEPGPQPFQPPPARRAFLGDAILAPGEDIELVVLSEQFDLDAFARLLVSRHLFNSKFRRRFLIFRYIKIHTPADPIS